jgi:hypothetical protein
MQMGPPAGAPASATPASKPGTAASTGPLKKTSGQVAPTATQVPPSFPLPGTQQPAVQRLPAQQGWPAPPQAVHSP